MLCQACNQNPATVRVIDITHPAPAASQAGAAPSSQPTDASSSTKSDTSSTPTSASGATASEATKGAPSKVSASKTGAPLNPPATPTSATSPANPPANAPAAQTPAAKKAASKEPEAPAAPAQPAAHERFLCEACAQAQHDVFGQAKDLAEVWKLLQAQKPSARKQPPGISCPDCGMTLRDFRQRGRLGCPKDYEVFGAQLHDLLERIHGGARHVGRGPHHDETTTLRRKRLDQLQQALASAIRDEDYEEAAKLRDEIKSLEPS